MRNDSTQLATTCYSKLVLTWTAQSVFCIEDVEAIPGGMGGVYVLTAFTIQTPTLVPFYVGQSRCLRRRLTEHLLGQRTFARHLRRRLSTYFSLAVVTDPTLRTAAEASLIRRIKPAGNEVVPGAPPVLVNLPSFSLLDT